MSARSMTAMKVEVLGDGHVVVAQVVFGDPEVPHRRAADVQAGTEAAHFVDLFLRGDVADLVQAAAGEPAERAALPRAASR